MEDVERIQALAQFLKIEASDIRNDGGDYFTVSPRKKKQGDSPEQIAAAVAATQVILSKKEEETVSAYIDAVRLAAELGDTPKERKQKEKIRKSGKRIYDKLAPKIAEAQDIHRRELDRISGSDQAAATKREAIKSPLDSWGHWQNLLYRITDHIDPENREITQQLRASWKGESIEDKRETIEVDNGQYRVLIDEEADEEGASQLDEYIEEVILPEIPEYLQNYFDAERWKNDAEYDGRAHNIATYDGEENSETVNGTEYYIYRTN